MNENTSENVSQNENTEWFRAEPKLQDCTHMARSRASHSFSLSLGLILFMVRYSSPCCDRKSSSSSEWYSAWGNIQTRNCTYNKDTGKSCIRMQCAASPQTYETNWSAEVGPQYGVFLQHLAAIQLIKKLIS